MDELTQALWEYAGKYRLESCYDRHMQEEREENERAVKKNQEKLEKLCPAEIWERIEILCFSLEILRSVDEEAAFTCGLRLGLSLR